jgi:DNA polymerase III gamma/tau subunit
MSLYLKYRSQTFDNIVEQDFTKDILKAQVIRSIAGEHFNNYLFVDPDELGKQA